MVTTQLEHRVQLIKQLEQIQRKMIACEVFTAEDVADIGGACALLALDADHITKPVPQLKDGDIKRRYKCKDCGHEQDVSGCRSYGSVYMGSGANWCDKCSGLPVLMFEYGEGEK